MTTATVVNGVGLQGLQDMTAMVKAQPAIAQATFEAVTGYIAERAKPR